MFLNFLNESEKGAFVVVANAIVKADGKVTAAEVLALNKLLAGMDCPTQDNKTSEEDALKTLSNAKEQARKATWLELFSLALADGNYDIKEKQYLQKIQQRLKLSDNFCQQAADWLKSYNQELQRGYNIVMD
jgi:tellurite resistance protein